MNGVYSRLPKKLTQNTKNWSNNSENIGNIETLKCWTVEPFNNWNIVNLSTFVVVFFEKSLPARPFCNLPSEVFPWIEMYVFFWILFYKPTSICEPSKRLASKFFAFQRLSIKIYLYLFHIHTLNGNKWNKKNFQIFIAE